jgi:hypothetical protein
MLGDYSYASMRELLFQDPPEGSGYQGLTKADLERCRLKLLLFWRVSDLCCGLD